MDDDFDKHIIFAQSKTIYRPRQEEDINDINEKSMMILEQYLNLQIYFSLDYVKQQIALKNKKVLNKLSKHDDKHKKTGFSLPIFNQKFIDFLPQSLENQFQFRFEHNIYSNEYDCSTQNIRLWTFEYGKNKQQNNNLSISNEIFVKSQSKMHCRCLYSQQQTLKLGSKLMMSNFNLETDVLAKSQAQTLTNSTINPQILILHDFYQHPMLLVPFINFLRNNSYNAFCPYLNDLIIRCSCQVDARLFKLVYDELEKIVEAFIPDRKFIIIAHGTSTVFAIPLQKKFSSQCLKLILCSPMAKYILKEKQVDFLIPENSQHSQRESFHSHTQVFSCSEHSGSRHAYSQDDNDLQNNSSSEIEYVQIRMARKFTIQSSQRNDMLNIARQAEQELSDDSEKQKHKSNQNLQHQRDITSDTQRGTRSRAVSILTQFVPQTNLQNVINLTAQSQLSKMKQIQQELQEESDCKTNYISFLNDKMLEIFQDDALLTGYLLTYEASCLKDLELIININNYISIYRVLRSTKKMQTEFMNKLFGLFVLSPIKMPYLYQINKQLLNNEFFESINELQYYFVDQKTLVDHDQTVFLLVGSHDGLMDDYLEQIYEVNQKYKNIHCRTLLGVSHDIFSVCPEIVLRLLK